MVIDNFNSLEVIIKPKSEYDFWFGQIIARRKDVPDLHRSDKLIKSYYIRNFDHLLSKESEIKTLCKLFKARFYVNPNVRNFSRINVALIKALVTDLENKQYSNCVKNLDSVCGYTNIPGREKLWVLDLDGDEVKELEFIKSLINKCKPNVGNKIKLVNPTLNGVHIITSPFDLLEFNINNLTNINSKELIKKNSPTLIYFTNE